MPSSKKRQTKISLSPGSLTSRYAKVTYEGSPAKKLKLDGEPFEDYMFRSDGPSSSAAVAAVAPPSPERSSQLDVPETMYDGSDGEPDQDGRHLTDTDSDEDSFIQSTRKRRNHKNDVTSTNIFARAPIISPKAKDKTMRTAADKKKRSRKEKVKVRPPLSDGDQDDDDDLPVQPSRSQARTKKPQSKPVQIASSGDDDNEPENIDSCEESEDEPYRPTTPSKNHLADSESDDDVRPSTQRSRKPTKPASNDSDSEIAATQPRNSTAQLALSDSDEVEDAGPSKIPRRKLRQRKRNDDEEDEDAIEIAAEAKDLKKSTVFKKHKGGRLRDRAGDAKKNDRRSRLEQLKAQREGRTIEVPSDDDDDDVEMHQTLDADDDDDNEDDLIINDEDSDAGAHDSADDDAAMLGLEMMRHGQRSLKEHFIYVVKSMLEWRLNPGAASELEQLYKVSILRVNREASGLVDRLISSAWVEPFVRILKARPGYEESPLEKDPDVLGGKCSACNRSGHPPSFLVRLKGKAYRKEKLEQLKDEDEGEDGDEDDEDSAGDTSEDEEGHKLVDEDRDWYLGTSKNTSPAFANVTPSFCRSNAVNAHSLIHWRIHLRDWLNSYLEGQGYLSSAEIVKRDKWSTQRRARFVDEIMDDLERTRQIKALWYDLKAKLEAAPQIQGQRYNR